ncbi:MAG: preprotein translocase subunit YajC [Prevotella sp.]|jgi:preprotein translocase subunit YajC|nr:preprotein translocase subunit YajC [Prevotella sp.]
MSTLILQAQAQGGGGMGMILMMVAIFAIMWFFMIRPQQKKQKEIRNFQNSLQEGAKVVTGGGLYGTVKRIDLQNNVVEVEVAHNVVVRVDRNYVFADASAMQGAQK